MNLEEKLDKERQIAREALKYRDPSKPECAYYFGIIHAVDCIERAELEPGHIIWSASHLQADGKYEQGMQYMYQMAERHLKEGKT